MESIPKGIPYDRNPTGEGGWTGATGEDRTFDPKTFLARVGKGRTVMDLARKEAAYQQGDPSDALFYIQTGQVKLSVVSEDGREAIIAMLQPEEFFGEDCLYGQPLRLETAAAITECSVMRLEKQHVIRVLSAEPAFAETFLQSLLVDKAKIRADLVNHKFNNLEIRLARQLLLLSNFGAEAKPRLTPQPTHDTLAKLIGASLSKVNECMNKFRKLGFIDYNGGLLVHSSLLSVVLHD